MAATSRLLNIEQMMFTSRDVSLRTERTMNGKKGIYAILDTVAGELGGAMAALQVHRAEAAAVRLFADLASTQGSMIQKNPRDYELVRLGWLDDSGEQAQLIPDYHVVLTGAMWAAAQTQTEGA